MRKAIRPLIPLVAAMLVIGASGAKGVLIHTVRPGDTPWKIAKLYGITVEELLRANGLDEGGVILPGQRLKVPLSGAPGLPRWVRFESAPLLAEPSKGASKVCDLKRGERVFYLGEKRDGFARVLADGGVEGWVEALALTDRLPSARSSPTSCIRYVGDGPARLRKGPGLEYGVITLLPEGVRVSLLDVEGDWAKVVAPGGKVGWVHRKLLKVSPPGSVSRGGRAWRFVVVKRGPARLRKGPGTEFGTLDLVPTGARLEVLGKLGDWLKVRALDGKVGWVAGWLVGLPGSPDGGGSGVGRKIVALAVRYLGVRYRRGGTTSRGMDCSGLVYRVFALLGRRVPHRAAALYRLGRPVKRSELRPGDLVFFRSWRGGRRVGHVGIYIGNGKFVHASSGRGRVVISDLTSGSYAKRYVGARRLW